MAATEEQKQAANTLREAAVWMTGCPVPGSGGDALFDTFQSWFEQAVEHHGLSDAYEAEMAEEDARIEAAANAGEPPPASGGDTEQAFWDAVLARL